MAKKLNRVLEKGINQLYLTISEKNTINNAIYTMIIRDETTHEEKSIVLLDTSTNAIRYNQFEIVLVDNIVDEDLANGIVCLRTGKHTYTFTATTPPDLSPSAPAPITIECEVGIVKVIKHTPSPIESYTDSLPTQEYISYTGGIDQAIN